MSRIVSYTLDEIPPISEERMRELKALSERPDSEIDLSDIPELTDEQLAQMRRAEFFRPIKNQVTARLDADVIAWLKAGGQGYQTRMNAILRRAMLADLARRAKGG